MSKCPHCGFIHEITCPRIKSIEYHENGVTIKRVEFHEQRSLHVGPPLPQTLSGPAPDWRTLFPSQ